jgi:hypothetical protein
VNPTDLVVPVDRAGRVALAVRLYRAEGWFAHEIGRLFGVTRQAVVKLLKRAGVELRSKADAARQIAARARGAKKATPAPPPVAATLGIVPLFEWPGRRRRSWRAARLPTPGPCATRDGKAGRAGCSGDVPGGDPAE